MCWQRGELGGRGRGRRVGVGARGAGAGPGAGVGVGGGTLDKGAPPQRTFSAQPPSAGVTLRASHVRASHSRPVRGAVTLPVWTKRRHVDLCRTQGALCS
ncbi:putative leader peptide [Streptomyces liliiviolaceus]|uniref:putative leader peptide n=1 Tax=Streptomyces liliiviolaceus TaxID=2823109 RepID=UPI00389AAB0A